MVLDSLGAITSRTPPHYSYMSPVGRNGRLHDQVDVSGLMQAIFVLIMIGTDATARPCSISDSIYHNTYQPSISYP